MGVLSGVRVVEFEGWLAGSLLGMLLADQGAEVIRIARPGAPIYDRPGVEVLARGKQSIVLDLGKAEDCETALRLAVNADIVIENLRPGALDKFGLNHAVLRAHNPRLVHVRLPGFASDDGEHAGLAAYDGIIAATLGMFTDLNIIKPMFGMDPDYTPLAFPSIYGAVHGAIAACAALYNRDAHDRGVSLEIPLAASAAISMSSIYMQVEGLPDHYITPKLPKVVTTVLLPLARKYWRNSPERQQKAYAKIKANVPALMDSYTCADGRQLYVFAIDHARLAPNLLRALRLYDEALAFGFVIADPYHGPVDAPNLATTASLPRKAQGWLRKRVGEVLATNSAAEWEIILAGAGVPVTIVRSTAEWMQTQALHNARVIETTSGRVAPGRQCWFPGEATIILGSPPGRDQHGAKLRALAGGLPLPEPNTLAAPVGPWQPYAGLKVLDFCSMVAGPVAGRTLAELGAEVIKIEATHPLHGPRMTCLYGLDVNQGKASTLIDLSNADGRALVTKLISSADIVLHNMTPAAAKRAGLDAKTVATLNADAIVCSFAAYAGPVESALEQKRGYDPVLQMASGIGLRYSSADAPELHGIASCIDNLTGYSGVFGIAAALVARRRGHSVVAVKTSLAQAATLVQLPMCLDPANETARGQEALGESDDKRLVRTADGWIFIDARTAEQRQDVTALFASRRPIATASAELLRALRAKGVAGVTVNSVNAVRKLAREGRHSFGSIIRQTNGLTVLQIEPHFIRADNRKLQTTSIAEKAGQTSAGVAARAGYSADAVESLIASGAIAQQLHENYLP
jgi:crotonobetainyl-CoA:carnitine CoA-transferase CaiB-like acyl-CoA transferase